MLHPGTCNYPELQIRFGCEIIPVGSGRRNGKKLLFHLEPAGTYPVGLSQYNLLYTAIRKPERSPYPDRTVFADRQSYRFTGAPVQGKNYVAGLADSHMQKKLPDKTALFFMESFFC
jgi:hypothetical protein